MSGETAVRHRLPSAACRGCERTLGEADQRICQVYDDGDGSGALEPGAIGFCAACRPEVAELVDTWNPVPEPPVAADSIAAGYERVADDCSFCADALSDRAVGLEYYRAGTDHDGGVADRRHYALCGHCVGVFAEFLDEVAAE